MKTITYRVYRRTETSNSPTPDQPLERRICVRLAAYGEAQHREFTDVELNFLPEDLRHEAYQPGACFELRAL